jgi:hypothetical protein
MEPNHTAEKECGILLFFLSYAVMLGWVDKLVNYLEKLSEM